MTPHSVRAYFLQARIVFSLLAVLALAPGCASKLQAIQDFANISAESAEYTALVDDYVQFPVRQQRYQPPSRHAALDTMAQERAAQKDGLLLRQTIVEKYMQSLGQLAADEIVENADELSQLSAALRTHAGTNTEETQAYEKIAGILTRVASDRWRQHRLRDLIEQSNPPIQRILGSLRRIVSDGFGGDLQTEEAAIQNYYTTLIMESNDPAAKAALAEWKELRNSQVEERALAVQTYRTVLDTIANGHQQLFDRRQDLNKKEVLQQVKNSVKDVRSLLNTLKKL